MKEYRLKKTVTNKDLMLKGFNIVTTGKSLIAVKVVPGWSPTSFGKSIIIYLDPPERVVKWRYPSDEAVPLDSFVQDFIELLDIEGATQFGETGTLTIAEWAKVIHENAKAHGFWENVPAFGDVCILINTEISEAFEEYRGENRMFFLGEGGKPEGVAVEFVDAVFRVFDYLEGMGVDIEAIMKRKHEYNKSRPYKHGGKRV